MRRTILRWIGFVQAAPLPYSCSDPFTIQDSDGTLTSCAPYRCKAGACNRYCDVGADCAQGYNCSQATSRCVPGH